MKLDDRKIVNEITLKVTGTLDIGRALTEAKEVLSTFMPVDEIVLVRVDESDFSLHLVLRITKDGLLDRQNQFLFLLDKDKRRAEEIHKERQGEKAEVFVLSKVRKVLNHDENYQKRFRHLGLPNSSDALVLFDRELSAGLIAVSYKKDVFSEKHVRLFEQLREPFHIALSNALVHSKVQRMRDELEGDSRLFREATVRLTGEPDIEKAFQSTLLYLKQTIPVREMMVIAVDDHTLDQRVLLRTSENGTVDDVESLLFSGDDQNFIKERDRMMAHLPETFVRIVTESDFQYMSPLEKAEKMKALKIREGDLLILLGVKSKRSGFLFICDKVDAALQLHCLRTIETLKEPFIIALYNAVRFFELDRLKKYLEEDNRALQGELQREVGDRVIGMDGGLRQIMSLAGQVAKTPSPVLLSGETGSGKEVVATAIHRMSDRASFPFISINCGAIPETLIDSELFGHERGAFTGADERKRGRFERADRGTLFLDEVGELPLSAQVRLLRVLQEKEFERVGGHQVIRADVRLIAATNRNLPAMVKNGRFREDLWFRLNVFPIEIPPLRERREDIPHLAYYFIETKCRQLNLSFRPALPKESMERLIAYDWPGNVRELQNAIERALILSRGEPLRFTHLTQTAAADTEPSPRPMPDKSLPTYDEAAAAYLKSVLEFTKGRIAGPLGAAKITGLNPSTLRSKLKKLEPYMSEQDKR
jgi:transcriptional regulator with GAF, ATPase, and Fis domain